MEIPRHPADTHKSRLYKGVQRFAKTGAGQWFLFNVSRHVDPVLLRATGGRLSTIPVARLVNLTVPGRKSGEPRTTSLLYFTDADEVVLIASSFGRDKHPAWYHNVVAHPEVELEAAGKSGRYLAREVEGAERDRLYGLAIDLYPGYADYREKTQAVGRSIPVLALRPIGTAAG
jgi:deazaflavin-dependent oxidoreductase (nitroreductase family)